MNIFFALFRNTNFFYKKKNNLKNKSEKNK